MLHTEDLTYSLCSCPALWYSLSLWRWFLVVPFYWSTYLATGLETSLGSQDWGTCGHFWTPDMWIMITLLETREAIPIITRLISIEPQPKKVVLLLLLFCGCCNFCCCFCCSCCVCCFCCCCCYFCCCVTTLWVWAKYWYSWCDILSDQVGLYVFFVRWYIHNPWRIGEKEGKN